MSAAELPGFAEPVAQAHAITACLVAARFAGLFAVSPVFRSLGATWFWRAGAVVLLTMAVVPVLSPQSTQRVELSSLPIHGAAELVLGWMLGLGIAVVISGIQIGGRMIDAQAGTALQEVLVPGSAESTTPISGGLTLFAAATLLVALPGGGHLWIADALLHSFTALPAGAVTVSSLDVAVLHQAVEQSLLLAIRVAIPVLAVMTLVSLCLSLFERAGGLSGGFAASVGLRIVISVTLVAVAAPATGEALAVVFEEMLHSVADFP